MSRPVTPRTVVAGILAALVVLAIFTAVVGLGGVVGVVASAEPLSVLGVFAATAAWLVAWGLSLSVSLRCLGVPVSRGRSVVVYTSAVFLNSVTPFAQVGGEALSAAVIARTTDTEYQTGLAAVTAVDVVNLMPTPLIALAGVTWLVVEGAGTPRIRTAILSFLGVSLAVAVVGGLTWHYRVGVGRRLVGGVVGIVTATNRLTGRIATIDLPDLVRRVDAYLQGVARVFADRDGLGRCLGLSVAGWVALVLALWLSLHAVGHPVSIATAAVVLPIGMLAIVVPLPGGVGGVEAALVGLLVGLAGVPLTTATAGVLIYRGATYWTPLLFGGVVTAVLSLERGHHTGDSHG